MSYDDFIELVLQIASRVKIKKITPQN